MSLGLNAARILVTRPVFQADHLIRLINSQGGQVLHFPTLEILAADPDPNLLQTAVNSDWLVFTSRNAVDFAIKAFGGKMPDLKKPQIAAIGQTTAKCLQQAGFKVDCVPAETFNSEALLAEPKMQDVLGKTCVIVRGIGGLEVLAGALRKRGAEVIYLEVYRRAQPAIDNSELKQCLASGQLDAVIITSNEALENLLAMVDEASAAALRALPLVVVSDRIRQTAEKLGFKRIGVSQQPTDPAILDTLTTLFNGENSGRSNRRTTRNSSQHIGG